jgi:hypothetical protein
MLRWLWHYFNANGPAPWDVVKDALLAYQLELAEEAVAATLRDLQHATSLRPRVSVEDHDGCGGLVVSNVATPGCAGRRSRRVASSAPRGYAQVGTPGRTRVVSGGNGCARSYGLQRHATKTAWGSDETTARVGPQARPVSEIPTTMYSPGPTKSVFPAVPTDVEATRPPRALFTMMSPLTPPPSCLVRSNTCSDGPPGLWMLPIAPKASTVRPIATAPVTVRTRAIRTGLPTQGRGYWDGYDGPGSLNPNEWAGIERPWRSTPAQCSDLSPQPRRAP